MSNGFSLFDIKDVPARLPSRYSSLDEIIHSYRIS
jgi:hypothetical protein